MQLGFQFVVGNNKKYKVNGIQNNMIYTQKSIIGQLLDFYYLVIQKNYLKIKNIWEFIIVI